jgi:hypothetical protein
MATSYSNRLGTAPEEGVKAPCVAVSVNNITLTGEQTVGGVLVTAGKRVLVMGQTNPADNGIYDSNASAWSRATDWNEGQDIVNGQMVIVPNAIYQASFVGDIVIGTTEVSFINVLSANNTTIVESFTATAGQTIFTLTTSTYTPAANNIDVYINGVRQSNQSYVETSSTVITFVEGLYAGDLVDLVVNQRSVGVDIILSSNVTHTRDTDSGGATVSLAAELHRTTTGNVTVYELGTTAAASSHAGIITGHIIRTNYFDSARTSGSGAEHSYTGVTTLGKAGNWPDADGYFYDADGKQFAVVGSPVSVLWFGAVPGGADCTANIYAALAASKSVDIPVGIFTCGLLTIPTGRTLTGHSRDGSELVSASSTLISITGTDVSNVVLQNMTITTTALTGNGSVFVSNGAHDITIQNCNINAAFRPFQINASTNANTAYNVKFLHNKTYTTNTSAGQSGIRFRTGVDELEDGNCLIEGNNITIDNVVNEDVGIESWLGGSRIINNTVVAVNLKGGFSGIVLGVGESQTVVNNYVFGFDGGIEVGGSGKGLHLIEGNVIKGCGFGISVSTTGGEESVRMIGNLVEFDDALRSDYGTTGALRIKCKSGIMMGNTLIHTDSSAVPAWTDYTDTLSRQYRAIYTDTATEELIVSGNIIKNFSTGVQSAATGPLNTITGNIFDNVRFPVIDTGGIPKTSFTGNMVRNFDDIRNNGVFAATGNVFKRESDYAFASGRAIATAPFISSDAGENTLVYNINNQFENCQNTAWSSDAGYPASGTGYSRPKMEIQNGYTVLGNITDPAALREDFADLGLSEKGITVRTWSNNDVFIFNEVNVQTARSAAPVAGTWVRGDIVTHTSPTAGSYAGWVCTTGGTPGTWKGYGLIEA